MGVGYGWGLCGAVVWGWGVGREIYLKQLGFFVVVSGVAQQSSSDNFSTAQQLLSQVGLRFSDQCLIQQCETVNVNVIVICVCGTPEGAAVGFLESRSVVPLRPDIAWLSCITPCLRPS